MFRQVLAMQVLQLSDWRHITVVGGDKALAVPQPEEKTLGAIVAQVSPAVLGHTQEVERLNYTFKVS